MKRFIRRTIVIWTIEIVALLLLSQWMSDFNLFGWQAAFWGVAVIGLLNAIVRPVLLYLTLPFTILTFGLLTLVLNGLLIVAAGALVPGFYVAGIGTGIVVSLGLTMLNTLLTGLFSVNDDDSYYRNVVARLARRSPHVEKAETPGLIILEIDGLAEPVLQRALADGHMPTLAQWVNSGTHRIVSWNCGLPSQTSASQAGILYGNNFDIPAFRWYEKEQQRMIVSNYPADAAEIARRASTGDGLLWAHGSSFNNLVDGDARHVVLTMSRLTTSQETLRSRSNNLYLFLYNPYNFSRVLLLMLWDIVVETWERVRQRIQDVRPRVARSGIYPLLRAVTTILLRDLSIYLLIQDMFASVSVAYTTFVGYDEVAHHAGIERKDVLRILRQMDEQFRLLETAAARAPRQYEFVVLSDHGQSQGATFRQRYGQSLEELLQALLSNDQRVQSVPTNDEGWGYLNAVLSEAVQPENVPARAARRLLSGQMEADYVDVSPEPRHEKRAESEAVVCVSGNLGLIYFSRHEGRMSLEAMAAAYPALIDSLIAHEGIGFALVRSERHGPLVVGESGIHYLATGQIDGHDPLRDFGPHAVEHLKRLDSFPHVGDIVVNSLYDPVAQEVAAFEEQVGSHGGLGGLQNQPFLMFPSHWPLHQPIVGAQQVFDVLTQWLDDLQPERAFGPVDNSGYGNDIR